MTENVTLVRERLEACRRNLLDVSLRNRLIHYRPSRTTGVEVVGEDPAEVFRILVLEQRAMTFVAKREGTPAMKRAPTAELPSAGDPASTPERAPASEPSPPAHPPVAGEMAAADGATASAEAPTSDTITAGLPGPRVDTHDTKLQTRETPQALKARLLKTWRDAQASLDEQGVNVLFLALGMLEWYEADASKGPRLAPLLLVPVSLERGQGDVYRLRSDGTEVGANLSIGSKLRIEFGIRLPELPDLDALDLRDHLASVAAAIQGRHAWKVHPDAIALGFFSYARYLMYKDLEGNDWPAGAKPWDHPLMAALLDAGFPHDEGGVLLETALLDQHRPIAESYEVCDADGSQALALLQAARGHSMVIQGPPGTGKSQTITNLIADAVARGRTVLFVAEKSAALEVVARRLREAGQGDACLELHADKANRRQFYAELQRTVELGRPKLEALEAELKMLEQSRDALNDYCQAVNESLPGRDITPRDAMGRLIALGEEPAGLPRLDLQGLAAWSRDDFKLRLETVRRLQEKTALYGPAARHPFYGSGLRLLLPTDQRDLAEALERCRQALDRTRADAAALATALHLPGSESLEAVQAMARAGRLLADAPPLAGVDLSEEAWLACRKPVESAIEAGKTLAVRRLEVADRVRPEAWSTPLVPVRQTLETYGRKWWRMLSSLFRAARNTLRTLCAGPPPKRLEERLALLDAVIEGQRELELIRAAHPSGTKLFGIRWQGEASDWEGLEAVFRWLRAWHTHRAEGTLPPELTAAVGRGIDQRSVKTATDRLEAGIEPLKQAVQRVTDALQLELAHPFHALESLEAAIAQLEGWRAGLPRLRERIEVNLVAEQAQAQELQPVIDLAATWEEAGEGLATLFERAWLNAVLREAFTARPALARFNRQSHERLASEFQRLDRLMIQVNRARVARLHFDRVPRHVAGGSLGLLQREFHKKSRHLPIRKAMTAAGEAVQAIKPVFMMSPLSVAAYLPPEAPKFDLVIFDEASQVKPEDALGAVIRGRQVVVVGDSRQMPPTSFFDKLTSAGDDEEEDELAERNVTRDMESILSLMDSRIPPSSPLRRDLRWHYRSRHHSLIAVSNRQFYRDRLVVFPNPEPATPRAGLALHHLPHTVYGRGGARTNLEEAKAVVEAVIRHVREEPGLTLGVVAFSSSQQRAIQDQLDKVASSEPALAAFDGLHPHEKLFVKNLENVQGDERDVILISVGYGRDADGYVSMNFGPLNKEGGERRLNVLISRARVRCEVFTNLTDDDLRPGEVNTAGVSALRTFLHYARTGELDTPEATGREPMSPFEEAVIDALEPHGYSLEPQVGSAGFYLDIGVRGRKNPAHFVLGIECDGAKYHSARTARDRDRLRQAVLEARGWRIHRIWSTDWWQHPDRELRRTIEAVEAALALEAQEAPRTLPPPVSPTPTSGAMEREAAVEREAATSPPAEATAVPYEVAPVELPRAAMDLASYGPTAMRPLVMQIVEIESPVHIEEVVRRLREAAGLARAGARIRDAVETGIEAAVRRNQIEVRGEFLHLLPSRPVVARNRAGLPAAARKLELIAEEEIVEALRAVVEASFGIAPEEAAIRAARLLGFERTTGPMLDRLLAIVALQVAAGTLLESGGLLRVARES